MGEQSGVARELLEGWTMFLAVAVLFYVSNWMLSKADTIAWERYISGKVQQSIDRRSHWTLIFAAFIAVMREGAELILFYQASFTGGMSDPVYIVYGIAAGVAVLVAVWIAFRYFSVRLPLKAFFLFTSILLFVMCVSFMGKGVQELTEADVITGRTVIPAMNGFSIEVLSIYDRAETLIPQIMLVIAALFVLTPNAIQYEGLLLVPVLVVSGIVFTSTTPPAWLAVGGGWLYNAFVAWRPFVGSDNTKYKY